uniref:Uncharacterized protein n=1 Tax=Anopheles atroparvus TaxID=41427 RepID=A0A182J3H5_ANOAO
MVPIMSNFTASDATQMLNEQENTSPSWPDSVCVQAPVAEFQMRALLSAEAVSSRPPGGLKVTFDTSSAWPAMMVTSSKLPLTSHTLAVQSALPVASRVPVQLNATSSTSSLWVAVACAASSLRRSQSLAVRSSELVAIRLHWKFHTALLSSASCPRMTMACLQTKNEGNESPAGRSDYRRKPVPVGAAMSATAQNHWVRVLFHLVHVDQQPGDGHGADGFLEEQRLDGGGTDRPQQGKQQQKATEARRLAWIADAHMLR